MAAVYYHPALSKTTDWVSWVLERRLPGLMQRLPVRGLGTLAFRAPSRGLLRSSRQRRCRCYVSATTETLQWHKWARRARKLDANTFARDCIVGQRDIQAESLDAFLDGAAGRVDRGWDHRSWR